MQDATIQITITHMLMGFAILSGLMVGLLHFAAKFILKNVYTRLETSETELNKFREHLGKCDGVKRIGVKLDDLDKIQRNHEHTCSESTESTRLRLIDSKLVGEQITRHKEQIISLDKFLVKDEKDLDDLKKLLFDHVNSKHQS